MQMEILIVIEGCTNHVIQWNGELCVSHRANSHYSTSIQLGTEGHGAKVKTCSHKGCTNKARKNRKKPRTQDGRKLRRYRRRWKIERLFAHLQNYRRVLVRHERYVENFLGFVQLGLIRLLLNRF